MILKLSLGICLLEPGMPLTCFYPWSYCILVGRGWELQKLTSVRFAAAVLKRKAVLSHLWSVGYTAVVANGKAELWLYQTDWTDPNQHHVLRDCVWFNLAACYQWLQLCPAVLKPVLLFRGCFCRVKPKW